MNKIIKKTVLLAAVALTGFACQSPEIDHTALDTVVAEREALSVMHVQQVTDVDDTLIDETFAITLATEGIEVAYDETWTPAYSGNGYYIQFEATAPVAEDSEGGVLLAGTYLLSDMATWQLTRAYVTILHDGATSSTAEALALTDGQVIVAENGGNYTFDVQFTTVLGTTIKGKSAQAEAINVEAQNFWFEPTAADKVLENAAWTASAYSFSYTEYSSYSVNVLTLTGADFLLSITYEDLPWDLMTEGAITSLSAPLPDSFYAQMGINSDVVYQQLQMLCFPYTLIPGMYAAEDEDEWGGEIVGLYDDYNYYHSCYILMGTGGTYSEVYYVSGKLSVSEDAEGKLKIVADLESSNGSTITVTYDEAAPAATEG